MIPDTQNKLLPNAPLAQLPTRTYALQTQKAQIAGMAQGLQAMQQAVYLILGTQRYEHVIYSWNYGVELLDLYGRPVHYALSEIKRRITQALLQDERITHVDNFNFTTPKKGRIAAAFTVHTIYGDILTEKEVSV